MNVLVQPSLTEEQSSSFEKNGFLILPGFFDSEIVSDLKNHLEQLWANRDAAVPLTIDCYLDIPSTRFPRRKFGDVEAAARNHPYKLNDTHLTDALIRKFCMDSRLMNMLSDLMGSRVSVCNTLLFERGSQQNAHFDTFYMPSKTPNKMCATWIAFDKVTDENGPLYYYPGSHLMKPYIFKSGTLNATSEEMPQAAEYIERQLAEHGLKPVMFYPNPGDVLIWHAQLLHGGSAIKDIEKTRTSLVSHYWTELDFQNAEDHIDIGDGRLFINKGHQAAPSKKMIDKIETILNRSDASSEFIDAVPKGFNPINYLLRNQDVLEAQIDPYTHYVQYGKSEGRAW